MKNLKQLLTCLFLFVLCTTFAQERPSADYISVVYLKDGSIFRGDIVSYERGGVLEIKIIGGQVIKFQDEEVHHIEQERVERQEPVVEETAPISVTPEVEENTKQIDKVILTNGSIFKGRIIESKEGDYVKLQLAGGDVLRLEADEIDTITKVEDDSKYPRNFNYNRRKNRVAFKEEWKLARQEKRNIYAFKEKGIYNVTYFSSTSGESEGEFQFGLGLHNITGYQMNRLFGLGIGFGVDTYSFKTGEVLYPVYLEGRGYLNKKINSPYYAVAAGYGFAFKNADEEILEADGGIMFHPSIGTRFGASEDTNILLDIGVKFQKARFVKEFIFSGEREEKDVLYQRLTIRLGVIF